MTDGQYRALITMVEYTARQVVDIKHRFTHMRSTQAQEYRRLREANAELRTRVRALEKENKELHLFVNTKI